MKTAYLMADISDVKTEDLKEILENLDALSCKCTCLSQACVTGAHPTLACTANLWNPLNSKNHDQDLVLGRESGRIPAARQILTNKLASEASGPGKGGTWLNQLI